jgi:hypothetical protein
MALIISSIQIFFDESDDDQMRDSLTKSMTTQNFQKIAEVKNERKEIIALTFQGHPQLLGVSRKPMIGSNVLADNLVKFDPAGGMK